MVPRGIPDDLDADTTQRIARTFLIVRIVRGGALLVFLGIALVAVEVKDWPSGVAIAIVVAMLLVLGAVGAGWRRYARLAARRHGDVAG